MHIVNYTLFRKIIPFLRIFFILSAGSAVLYFLISTILSGIEFVYLLLLLPVSLIVLFVMVSLVLSQILQLSEFSGSDMLTNTYTRKELMYLMLKCFIVTTGGVSLAIIFACSVDKTDKDLPQEILFYAFDTLLTLYAVGNIIKGEKLRELNIRNIQSENTLLKSQLNPHFLYNTLNNIDALVHFDQNKASESILKLSSLLRYMTYQVNNKTVTIENEINHIREYVELQRLRLDDPQVISFKTELKNPSIRIAPMLLMPFIENIFKHTSDKINKSSIFIQIEADQQHLIFISRNKYDSDKEPDRKRTKEGGVGLKNIERRLKLLYPNKFSLVYNKSENQFEVILDIKF